MRSPHQTARRWEVAPRRPKLAATVTFVVAPAAERMLDLPEGASGLLTIEAV